MRAAYIAILLCTLVLIHDVSSYSSMPNINFRRWTKVNKFGWWPVRSARFAVWKMLGFQPFSYQLWMKWAAGRYWNSWVQRFMQYRVFFNIRRNKFPYTKYSCRAWVAWPRFSAPYLIGGPNYNYCVPFK